MLDTIILNNCNYHSSNLKTKLRYLECADEVSREIDSRMVESSDKLAILGVNIDEKLTFSEHIKVIHLAREQVKKLECYWGCEISYLVLLNCNSINLTFYLTWLSYGRAQSANWKEFKSAHWEQFSSQNLNLTENYWKEPVSLLCKKEDYENIATLMYKAETGLVPQHISELFHSSHKGYNLKNSDFNIPRFRTTWYGKHSLLYATLGPSYGAN